MPLKFSDIKDEEDPDCMVAMAPERMSCESVCCQVAEGAERTRVCNKKKQKTTKITL